MENLRSPKDASQERGHAARVLTVLLLVIVGCAHSSPPRAAVATSTTNTTSTSATTTTSTSTTTTVAPTSATTVAPAFAGKVIVLDPGHNEGNSRHASEINQQVDVGNGTKACDTTGTATNDGYSEASFNTDVANRVAALLRDAGATVVLTRDASTAWGPCITERAAIGNDAHADAAISIHADGGPPDGRGFHVIEPLLVAGYNDGIIEPSGQLALAVRDEFRAATGLPFSTYLGHDGIDARDDLGGLNLSRVPKVFIETGNMRNAADAALLEDPAFRQQIAIGIADGLISFVNAR
jgi:N-acetylmuramoyl-L-alanine amidase